MDKQGRLTKWNEWEVGQSYRWLKGKTLGNEYLLVGIEMWHGRPGWIVLRRKHDGKLIPWMKQCWINRFVRCHHATT